jgi:2-(1,2-epoxy-1,2-dihydrophenyl)acetyl-CoA isomerase
LRRLMRSSFDRTLPEQLDAESAAFQACAATDDFRAGVDAFFARGKAVFNGR